MKKYIFLAFSFLMILMLCSSSAAAETGANYVNLTVANDNGSRLGNVDGTYTFFNRTADGINALKITNSSSNTSGNVVTTTSQSGTFYITSVGGKGYEDNVILMLAVNGTIPNNFQLHITASGYQWVPKSTAPVIGDLTYNSTTLNETFYATDFTYGPQTYKPMNLANYPLYEYQDMTNSSNTFIIMFIDLYSGILNNAALTDMGMVKIEYSFQNLPVNSLAAFNVFSYREVQRAVQWTNKVNVLGGAETGTSGYYVNGTTHINHAPVLNYIGNKTVNENKKLQFTLSGSDLDNDTLTYSASKLPAGASFNSATGTFTWTPNYNQAGKYQITFTLSDGSLTSSKTINITVNNVDITKPKVISTYPKSGATGFSRTGTIAIKFSENIKSSVNWSKIYMKNLKTGKLVSISKWISGNTLYIKMPLKRYAFSWYKLYIPASAVKDRAGNNASGYALCFKTGRY